MKVIVIGAGIFGLAAAYSLASNDLDTRQGLMEADAVICTTSAAVARNILPDLPGFLRSILDKVQYRPCCHVMFACDRRALPDGFDVVAFPRRAGCRNYRPRWTHSMSSGV
jgi:protoporphyrinogen oxidase